MVLAHVRREIVIDCRNKSDKWQHIRTRQHWNYVQDFEESKDLRKNRTKSRKNSKSMRKFLIFIFFVLSQAEVVRKFATGVGKRARSAEVVTTTSRTATPTQITIVPIQSFDFNNYEPPPPKPHSPHDSRAPPPKPPAETNERKPWHEETLVWGDSILLIFSRIIQSLY